MPDTILSNLYNYHINFHSIPIRSMLWSQFTLRQVLESVCKASLHAGLSYVISYKCLCVSSIILGMHLYTFLPVFLPVYQRNDHMLAQWAGGCPKVRESTWLETNLLEPWSWISSLHSNKKMLFWCLGYSMIFWYGCTSRQTEKMWAFVKTDKEQPSCNTESNGDNNMPKILKPMDGSLSLKWNEQKK